jgi:hypothetical protein
MHILHTHLHEGFFALIGMLAHAILRAIPALFTNTGTFSPLGQGSHRAPLSGIAQQALDSLAKLATATCVTITTFIIHKGPISPPNTWPLPCNRSTEIPLPSLHTTRMSSFSSPEETFVDASNGMHSITSAFRVPPSPLLGGEHLPTSRALECQGKTPKMDPTPEPTPIPTIREWARLLHTHTHEEFATLALLHKDHFSPPCMDVSGVALIRPSQIQHYVFGEWQGTMEVQECLEGIFKLLQLDPSISLMQQPEIDQILCLGEAPTRWTRARHFPPTGDPTHTSIPT